MSFTFRPAVRENTPLIIGIAGPTKSGKTYSALRVATGIANGGTIAMINAEGLRGHQYAEKFKYLATDIQPPYSPERYTEALKAALDVKPAVLIIDSASHMHDGPGGLLEYHDAELDRLSKGNAAGRDKFNFMAWVKPKAAENAFIYTMLGASCPIVLAFRAKEKIKIVNGKPVELGWQPIAGERITFETLFTLMLPPHSKGKPDLSISEMREPFDTLISGDKPLDEQIGRTLAAWARGGAVESAPASGNRAPTPAAAEPPAQPVDGRVKEQLLHDIKRVLAEAHPGQTPEAVAKKAGLLAIGFGTRQWKNVEPLPSHALRLGLEKIQAELVQTTIPEPGPAPTTVAEPADPMTDAGEIQAAMDRWEPAPDGPTRQKILQAALGTAELEKVDTAALWDFIGVCKLVADKDPEAVKQINQYLRAA